MSSFQCINDRLMTVRLKLKGPGSLFIIAIYAPTSASSVEEIDSFYEQLGDVISGNKRDSDRLIIAGDWNAKIGQERLCDKALGPHGYGVRNERGLRLIEFAIEHKLTAAHTWFMKKRALHKITWISRSGNARNAIDHILIDQDIQSWLTDCRSFSAVFDTDHRLMLCNMKMKLHRHKPPKQPPPKPNLNALKETTVCANLSKAIAERLPDECPLDTMMEITRDESIKVCGTVRNKAHKPHISDETLALIDEKKLAYGTPRYNALRNAVKRACKSDLDAWLVGTCQAVDEAFTKRDTTTLFKLTKVLDNHPRKPLACIKDGSGNTMDMADEIGRWHEYSRALFCSDIPRPTPRVMEHQINIPSRDVVRQSINHLKNGRATGSDGVSAEIIKVIAEDADVFEAIFKAVCKIWSEGAWPSSATTSHYIALFKKGDSGECGNYRTLALISHASKIVLHIMHTHLLTTARNEVSKTQCGFMPGMSTSDATTRLKLVAQAHLAGKRDLHLAFVDFKKAFDSVRHAKLFEILLEMGVPTDVVKLVEGLYNEANGYISWKGMSSPNFETPVGVRQGCPLSPTLFNLYTEAMMREWSAGVQHLRLPEVQGEVFPELRYADDLTLGSLAPTDTEFMLEHLATIGERYGLKLHPGKTEYMVVSATTDDTTITFRGLPIKRVNAFTYLGTTLTHNMDDTLELRKRIAMGRQALKSSSYMKSPTLNIETKCHLARSLIMSKVTYNSNSWTLKADGISRLNAFGRSVWRQLLGIKWDDFVTNEQLHEQIGDRWCFTADTILQRQGEWLSHLLRQSPTNIDLLGGMPTGCTRGRGRPRARYVDAIGKWCGLSEQQIVTNSLQRQPLTKQNVNPPRRTSRRLRRLSPV